MSAFCIEVFITKKNLRYKVQGHKTHIYDQIGHYVTTIPLSIIQWLWEIFAHTSTHPMIRFLQLMPIRLCNQNIMAHPMIYHNLPLEKNAKNITHITNITC